MSIHPFTDLTTVTAVDSGVFVADIDDVDAWEAAKLPVTVAQPEPFQTSQ